MLIHEELTEQIIGAAIEVHRELGPGLLESAYLLCLCRELSPRHIPFRYEVESPVLYKGVRLDCGYRIDLLVDESGIVELKATQEMSAVFDAQLLTYMRLTNLRVGLLINFNVPVLRNGVKRKVL